MRSNTPISMDMIRAAAPAVLTTEKAPTLFDAYEHVSSWNVIEALLDSGYGISRVQQINGKGLMPWQNKFSKHIVCLRPLESFKELVAGEFIPEIIYTAAHDGSSAIHMHAGLLRVVCSNGMMTGTKSWAGVRIPHKAGAEVAAIAGARELMDSVPRIAETVDTMRRVELSPVQQQDFARRALPLRLERPEAYDPGVLLMQRRLQDAGNDVWRVLNRIQENLTKGGFDSAPGPKGRVTRLGEVTRITADVSINRTLWDMAEELV